MKKSILALAFFLTSKLGFAYDKNDNFVSEQTLEQINKPTVEIKTYRGDNPISGGTGIVLMDKESGTQYVLTTAHILPDRLLGLKIRVDGLEAKITNLDRDNDLMLLVAKEGSFASHPFEGKIARKVKTGDYTIGLGFPPAHLNKTMYYGHIIRSEYPHIVYIEGHLHPGMSGGPVFVFDKGEPKLFGLNQLKFIVLDSIAGAVSPSRLEAFLKDSPVYNDYYDTQK